MTARLDVIDPRDPQLPCGHEFAFPLLQREVARFASDRGSEVHVERDPDVGRVELVEVLVEATDGPLDMPSGSRVGHRLAPPSDASLGAVAQRPSMAIGREVGGDGAHGVAVPPSMIAA